jgi:hypothetical protein
MQHGLAPTTSTANGWDRYYEVNVDLDPILGTPGIPSIALGESMPLSRGSFTQAAERGFFLTTDEPVERDPVELGNELCGAQSWADFATLGGLHRRRSLRTRTGTHMQFEHLIRGARVIGSRMRFHQEDFGGIYAITGYPLGEISERDPGPAPVPAGETALNTCAERFELEGGLHAASVEQVIFPIGERAIWAYEVGFTVPKHSADVRVFLRADDFSVLLSCNIASAASGQARVYSVNPTRTPELEEVAFADLQHPGNLLRSTSFDVRQGNGVRLDRADGNFAAEPEMPAFDEGQAYFHLSRAKEYFSEIVDPGLLQGKPFTPLVAVVNDPESPSNAYYLPSTGELRFGLFGDRSSARSASVVCHEFGHAVSDSICELGRSRVEHTEARGLSEGFSDYFAAAALDSPIWGDYIYGMTEGNRNCSDRSLRFPQDYAGEEHRTGAVWAALLWSIRQGVEPRHADLLAIESVSFLGSASTFDDARAALRAADEKLFGGKNRAIIEQAYAARSPE